MNFHETKMGSIFFNQQLPELIGALREIAAVLSKPAPAAIPLADMGTPDFLHNLFYGNYEPDIYGCVTVPSRLDQNVKEAEKALLPALGQSKKLFEQYQRAVSERNSAVAEQSYCCGYRTAVQMIVSGFAMPPQAGGAPDEQ
uniref:DUF6809 family protein n=1 Tax=Enterocloster clostridioformis TaxID=1531 RepID=UPI002676E00C|nr:DUF6809 family protein [Enterocloster clostridioformis]